MLKSVLLTGVALTLSIGAFAQAKKDTAPTEIKCAVMTQRTVNIKAATANGKFADYKGNRYFFCCGACPSMFKADPARYASGAHIPTPKAGKSSKKS